MQSSYLCSPVISISTISHLSSMNKHQSWVFSNYMSTLPSNQKYDILFSQGRLTVLRLQTSSFSATITFKPVSVICRLTVVRDLPGCFASVGSVTLYTSRAFLCMPVLGHTMLRLLPGYPNSEELEIRLCSILFIIPVKITGLLENRVQESAHKSLLFPMLIGTERGAASTSFLH